MNNFLIGDKGVEIGKIHEDPYIPYLKKKEIVEQSKRSRESIFINFESLNLRYYIFLDDPLSTKSVTISTFSNNTEIWKLKDNFEQWRFELKDFSALSSLQLSAPCKWGLGEMLVNLSKWDSEDDSLNNFYQSIFLWLIFDYIKLCPEKNKLRDILYYSNFIYYKPYRDLAVAELDFCRQLYPRSYIAQKAASEEHLWFCLQYSNFLVKTTPTSFDSKTSWRKEFQNYIAYFQKLITKKALRDDFEPDLSQETIDWRLDINHFLIVDAIEIIYANPEKEQDLRFHLQQYLKAQDHFRSIMGHKPEYDINKKRKRKSNRGRGRPPKSK